MYVCMYTILLTINERLALYWNIKKDRVREKKNKLLKEA